MIRRRKPVVRPPAPWILAVRKVQTSLGIRLPHQGQAIQEPPGIRRPPDMAALHVQGLQRLLLRALQSSQPSKGRRRHPHHNTRRDSRSHTGSRNQVVVKHANASPSTVHAAQSHTSPAASHARPSEADCSRCTGCQSANTDIYTRKAREQDGGGHTR
jgi:hypothetical protein